jgi:hypothetical protein
MPGSFYIYNPAEKLGKSFEKRREMDERRTGVFWRIEKNDNEDKEKNEEEEEEEEEAIKEKQIERKTAALDTKTEWLWMLLCSSKKECKKEKK